MSDVKLKLSDLISELDLPARAVTCLMRNKIKTVGDLLLCDASFLLGMRGLGFRMLELIKAELERNGFCLTGDCEEESECTAAPELEHKEPVFESLQNRNAEAFKAIYQEQCKVIDKAVSSILKLNEEEVGKVDRAVMKLSDLKVIVDTKIRQIDEKISVLGGFEQVEASISNFSKKIDALMEEADHKLEGLKEGIVEAESCMDSLNERCNLAEDKISTLLQKAGSIYNLCLTLQQDCLRVHQEIMEARK